jgi:C4-type Zn-finger protein
MTYEINNDRAIQEIACLKCKKKLTFIGELKDAFNSNFYISHYKCNSCNYSIEIVTREWRE